MKNSTPWSYSGYKIARLLFSLVTLGEAGTSTMLIYMSISDRLHEPSHVHLASQSPWGILKPLQMWKVPWADIRYVLINRSTLPKITDRILTVINQPSNMSDVALLDHPSMAYHQRIDRQSKVTRKVVRQYSGTMSRTTKPTGRACYVTPPPLPPPNK